MAPEMSVHEAHTFGMLCHLSALSTVLGVPFGNILGPLVVWLLKKKDHPFIDRQGKESLNFQISWTIYGFVALPLVLILVGIPLLLALAVSNLVLVIVASVKANEGESFSYPLTIRFFT